jgi:hypothetical protein
MTIVRIQVNEIIASLILAYRTVYGPFDAAGILYCAFFTPVCG